MCGSSAVYNNHPIHMSLPAVPSKKKEKGGGGGNGCPISPGFVKIDALSLDGQTTSTGRYDEQWTLSLGIDFCIVTSQPEFLSTESLQSYGKPWRENQKKKDIVHRNVKKKIKKKIGVQKFDFHLHLRSLHYTARPPVDLCYSIQLTIVIFVSVPTLYIFYWTILLRNDWCPCEQSRVRLF